MGKFQEPEEWSTENADFQPLNQPVNEKAYTRPNVKMNPQDMVNDIPEPPLGTQTIDLTNEPPPHIPPPGAGTPPQPPPPGNSGTTAPKKPEPMNSEMKDMPKKEQQKSAEHISRVIIDSYKLIHTEANKTLMFKERKLRKLAASGEVDFNIQIPFDHKGSSIPAHEFISEYNEQMKDTLVVTPEFEAEVMPVLTRVLQKRGIGFTDEQYLMYLFGKDISVKAMMYFGAKQQMNEIINLMKEATAQRGQQAEGKPYYATEPEQTPPPSPTVVEEIQEPEELVGDNVQEVHTNFSDIAPSVSEEVDAQLNGMTVSELRNRNSFQKPGDE